MSSLRLDSLVQVLNKRDRDDKHNYLLATWPPGSVGCGCVFSGRDAMMSPEYLLRKLSGVGFEEAEHDMCIANLTLFTRYIREENLPMKKTNEGVEDGYLRRSPKVDLIGGGHILDGGGGGHGAGSQVNGEKRMDEERWGIQAEANDEVGKLTSTEIVPSQHVSALEPENNILENEMQKNAQEEEEVKEVEGKVKRKLWLWKTPVTEAVVEDTLEESIEFVEEFEKPSEIVAT
ncbi:hypothetical protein Tco_0947360 [Tanacetum coccineum]